MLRDPLSPLWWGVRTGWALVLFANQKRLGKKPLESKRDFAKLLQLLLKIQGLSLVGPLRKALDGVEKTA